MSLVAGQVVDAGKNKCPGYIHLFTDDFRIEKVSQSKERHCEGDRNDNPVEHPKVRLILAIFCVDVHRGQNADRSDVAGQSALPYFEYFQRMGKIVNGIIEQAVP